MSFRPKRKPHFMSVVDLLYGARYVTCDKPRCGFRARRAQDKKPLIHNGGKP